MQKSVPFSIAIESRYPEQIAVCIARDAGGRFNPMTIGWFMPVSMNPPMFAVAVGKSRYTLEAIRNSGEFVLSFLSELQAGLARNFGSNSGRDLDKFSAFTCKTIKASCMDNLLILDAVANFECVVKQEYTTGDHVVFVGEVVCSHVTENPAGRMFTLVKAEQLEGVGQKSGGVP